MKTGDTINFGAYEWRALDIKNSAALIITKYIIEEHTYNDEYTDITWAECSLRKYLNGDFFNRFSDAERSRIIPVTNENHDNQWYGTNGGEDTIDSIFQLSIEEAVCKYFGDSSRLLYNPKKNQRYWFERKDPNNSNRIAKFDGAEWNSWWWLRSPGRAGVKAAYVHGNGDIGIQGNNIKKGNVADDRCAGGVRPAMWISV